MRARYDEVAGFYEESVGDAVDAPPDRTLLELLGGVGGLRVLDVACGHGRISRALARRGAEVTGVDVSRALLERARDAQADEPLGISYVHADATAAHTFAGQAYDAVVCAFGLSDIDDLDGVLATVARALRPGGTFAFSILHPCFPGWGPDVSGSWPPGGYWDEGWWLPDGAASSLRRRVGANHRTLSTYLNALVRYGLVVDEVAEPRPTAEWAARAPGATPVPVFLVVRARRVAA